MLPFLYQKNDSFQINRNTKKMNEEKLILEVQKHNLHIFRKTSYSNTDIQNTKLKKCNFQKCRNTNDMPTKIQVTLNNG